MWAARGMRGALTNGGTRDTDEAIYQKALPVWSRWIVQPMYQGRVEWGGHDMPVEIGGVLVRPGDLVVADGDGAIVVPIEVVDDVLKYAIQESENDKVARKMLFDHLGIRARRVGEVRLRGAAPSLCHDAGIIGETATETMTPEGSGNAIAASYMARRETLVVSRKVRVSQVHMEEACQLPPPLECKFEGPVVA